MAKPAAIPAIVKALDSPMGPFIGILTHAVGLIGPEAIPVLRPGLKHERKRVREHTIRALGQFSPENEEACRGLAQAARG